jgi:polyisoprenyl-phosphate glycosyltransferase
VSRFEAREEAGVTLSVVVPAYNESLVLPEFHRRLGAVLDQLDVSSEVVYVNDGSRDETAGLIKALRSEDDRVALVDLSRNFGKEIALTAGLDHARGQVVVIIDADLQDPPELIPELMREWEKGWDVVYATRTNRKGESWLKRTTAAIFYRVIQGIGTVRIPPNTGDFRLLSRRAVDALRHLREHHRFMKGLFAWIGYPQTSVPYERDPRFAGTTKWNYWKLWNFALEGITSFTVAPLKIATYVGSLTAAGSFIYGIVIILKTLLFGRDLPGYPSLMVAILFIGGIQLMALGVIGEYLGRIFNETKQRPLYFVQEHLAARSVERINS